MGKYFATAVMSLMLMTSLSGCTDNFMAKKWGGTMTIDLPCGNKLFEITWKDSNLWYATRAMRADETPEHYVFKEDSNFGMVEGTVNLIEHACPNQ